jgi:hypothetical protein
LLLCGLHHRPVDRHESLYSIDELLTWKAEQIEFGGAGTTLSEADVRAYARLSIEERTALAQLARLAERLTVLCENAQAEVDVLRARNEETRSRAASMFSPVYEVDEQGNRSKQPMSTDGFQLSKVEQDSWDDLISDTLRRHSDPVLAAVLSLSEEIAVLRMQSPGLRPSLSAVRSTADGLVNAVGPGRVLDPASTALEVAMEALWAAANGETG